MNKTLYLKYRPKSIDELDLQGVRETFLKLIASGKIPHAFLFSGPKGTGKTSAARILAKIVNCMEVNKKDVQAIIPCNKCRECLAIDNGTNLDVIEIDAASNRGVEDIRSLREAVKLAPNSARKKVYIIDEAHMLTTEASNALLKTLEEPPDHVIFILATTNPEKLIETIRSRTVNIIFAKATTGEIKRQLQRIIKAEALEVEEGVIETIAKVSDGSFRDSLKILESLTLTSKKLEAKAVEETLLKTQTFNIERILEFLVQRAPKEALIEIERVVTQGSSVKDYTNSIIVRLREALLVKMGLAGRDLSLDKKELISLLEILMESKKDLLPEIPQLALEMAIAEWCALDKKVDIEVKKVDPDAEKPEIIESKSVKPQITNLMEVNEEQWKNILAQVKPKNTSIEALLRAARPIGFDGKILTLGVFYKFHKERLETNEYRRILENVSGDVLGRAVQIVCTLTEPPTKKVPAPQGDTLKRDTILTEPADNDIIKAAKEIFGN